MEKERDIALVEETESAIHRELMKLKDREERRLLLERLHDYISHMNNVQACPQLIREHYYFCAFVVFKYLRANRQLGRKTHRFDDEVLEGLLHIIKSFKERDGV